MFKSADRGDTGNRAGLTENRCVEATPTQINRREDTGVEETGSQKPNNTAGDTTNSNPVLLNGYFCPDQNELN